MIMRVELPVVAAFGIAARTMNGNVQVAQLARGAGESDAVNERADGVTIGGGVHSDCHRGICGDGDAYASGCVCPGGSTAEIENDASGERVRADGHVVPRQRIRGRGIFADERGAVIELDLVDGVSVADDGCCKAEIGWREIDAAVWRSSHGDDGRRIWIRDQRNVVDIKRRLRSTNSILNPKAVHIGTIGNAHSCEGNRKLLPRIRNEGGKIRCNLVVSAGMALNLQLLA